MALPLGGWSGVPPSAACQYVLPTRWLHGKAAADGCGTDTPKSRPTSSYGWRLCKTRILPAAVTTFLLAGCGAGESDACSVNQATRPVEVVAQPEVAEVSESASNVGLDVTSTLEKAVRLTVRFDGKLALDIAIG